MTRSALVVPSLLVCLAPGCASVSSPAERVGLEPGAPPASADDGEPLGEFMDAVGGGEAYLKARYRVENVDQDGFDGDAWASTLRTVLGYRTAGFHGVTGLVEFENVSAVGNDLYDSTTNGVTDRPVVADPEDTEVNQAHLSWKAREDLEVVVGRRVLTFDNKRFIGNVGWRQNEQTYDVVSIDYTGVASTQLTYAFVENVNRIFGDRSPAGDAPMASHLLHAAYDGKALGQLVGYWYLLDFDTLAAFSSSTLGARYVLTPRLSDDLSGLCTLEYATQADAGANPVDVDADYRLVELGLTSGDYRVLAGYEVLSGSNTAGDKFQTPLATAHAFNGWADQFLTTPDAGLEDLYLLVGGKLGIVAWTAVWHTFGAETGSSDYGDEFGLQLGWPISKRIRAGLKFADYSADDFAVDTTKAWGWLEFQP